MNKKLWFKRRWYGWGWYPVTWQGWIVVLGFILAVIVLAFSTLPEENLTCYFISLGILILVLILICLKKGEKPKWQWGRPK